MVVGGAVALTAACALACGGCQARAQQQPPAASSAALAHVTDVAEPVPNATATFRTAGIWPSWMAVQLAGPRTCAKGRKWTECVWLFSTDEVEWVPLSRWFGELQSSAKPGVRHLVRQWCDPRVCRVVNVYIGPVGR